MEGRRRDRQLDQRLQPPCKVLVTFWPSGLQYLPSQGGGCFRDWGLGLRADKGFAVKAAGKGGSTVTLATWEATAAWLLGAEWPRGPPPWFLPTGHSWKLWAAVKKTFRTGRWPRWCPPE